MSTRDNTYKDVGQGKGQKVDEDTLKYLESLKEDNRKVFTMEKKLLSLHTHLWGRRIDFFNSIYQLISLIALIVVVAYYRLYDVNRYINILIVGLILYRLYSMLWTLPQVGTYRLERDKTSLAEEYATVTFSVMIMFYIFTPKNKYTNLCTIAIIAAAVNMLYVPQFDQLVKYQRFRRARQTLHNFSVSIFLLFLAASFTTGAFTSGRIL
jgi:uncharacterized membrane protein YfcA